MRTQVERFAAFIRLSLHQTWTAHMQVSWLIYCLSIQAILGAIYYCFPHLIVAQVILRGSIRRLT